MTNSQLDLELIRRALASNKWDVSECAHRRYIDLLQSMTARQYQFYSIIKVAAVEGADYNRILAVLQLLPTQTYRIGLFESSYKRPACNDFRLIIVGVRVVRC